MVKEEQMPPVIQEMYDLTMWLMERVEKFPRSSRFVLGYKIEESALAGACALSPEIARQAAKGPQLVPR